MNHDIIPVPLIIQIQSTCRQSTPDHRDPNQQDAPNHTDSNHSADSMPLIILQAACPQI